MVADTGWIRGGMSARSLGWKVRTGLEEKRRRPTERYVEGRRGERRVRRDTRAGKQRMGLAEGAQQRKALGERGRGKRGRKEEEKEAVPHRTDPWERDSERGECEQEEEKGETGVNYPYPLSKFYWTQRASPPLVCV